MFCNMWTRQGKSTFVNSIVYEFIGGSGIGLESLGWQRMVSDAYNQFTNAGRRTGRL